MNPLRPADEVARDDVVAVPVEVVPGPVVMRRRPGVGMPSGYLHVAEGNPSGAGAWDLLADIMAEIEARIGNPPESGSDPLQYDGSNPPSASVGGSGRGGEEAVPRFSDPAPACEQIDGGDDA